MKIAVIHPGYTGTLGGAEAVSYQIASALQEEHQVTHYTSENISPKKAKERFSIDNYGEANSKTVERTLEWKISEKLPRFELATAARRKKPYCKLYHNIKNKFDLIFFTSHLYDYKHLSEANFGEEHADTIIYHHSGPIADEELNPDNRLYNSLVNPRGKISQFKAELNIFNSKFSRNDTFKNGKVIYPPVEEDFNFDNETEKRIVYLGRISSEKRMEDAIKISNKTGLPLTIIGYKQDETYYRELKEDSQDNVEFITDASREEIKETLNQCRYGLNCGIFSEMFGIVTIEYMKSGVIPIVRNVTSNRETVQRSELRWDDINEAVSIINRLEKERTEEIEYIKSRKDDFGRTKFRKEILETINEF